MLPGEREVAGLRCSEVLGELSAYLDGELPPERAALVEAHVADCQVCASFGAGFGALVEAVRARMTTPEPLPQDVASRLHAALRTDGGRG